MDYDIMEHPTKISRRAFLQTSVATGTAALSAVCPARPTPAGVPEAGPWQIGCYTRVFDQWDYRIALDAIAEAGYRHVGLMTTKRTQDQEWVLVSAATPLEKAAQIGADVRKRGLMVPSLYGAGIAGSTSLAEGIQNLKRLIDNAQACGAKNLLLGGTNAKGQAYELYYQIIAAGCDYAQAREIGISVKPHGGTNATGPQCRKAIEKAGHPNFRIWYDPGNTFYYSEGKLDPVDDVATVSDLVVGMCIKDFLAPKNVFVTPGTGRVDFATVLARLVAGGFTQGPLIVECVKRDGDLKQTIAEARQARLYLEGLVAG
jgi:sugar phosphate isomerase/epimerase